VAVGEPVPGPGEREEVAPGAAGSGMAGSGMAGSKSTAPASAPGRHQVFDVDPRRTVLYRTERMIFVTALWAWFRPKVSGAHHVPESGPVILAPVHRSFADFGFAAFCTERKLFFMTKDEMWENKWLGKLLLSVGAFPVHRESADREALQRAEAVLRMGEVLVLFPEGTRRDGPVIEDLMEGAAFLSARTGAPIVPVGIGGSDLAMPKGSALPKPRTIEVVVGPAIPPPARTGGGRVSRTAVHAATEALVPALQAVYDEARDRTGRY
jgi:1-acyl-sn-glycerol-3-phosphate acyltransferase